MVIHHGIFEYAIHIIARLAERDFLNPLHHIDATGAGIAIGLKPFVHIARPAIIGSDGQRIASAEISEHAFNIGRAKCDIIVSVDR